MKQKLDHFSNIGKKIGRLTIQSVDRYSKYYKYNCKCDCGNTKTSYSHHILRGFTTSCGCYYNEMVKLPKTKPRSDIKLNGESSANYVFLTYKRNAVKRSITFNLNKEFFTHLIVKNCYYCGCSPSQAAKYWNKKNSKIFVYNGIDRVDNDLGYILNNVVSCCNICNKAKGTISKKLFYDWIARLTNFNGGIIKDV